MAQRRIGLIALAGLLAFTACAEDAAGPTGSNGPTFSQSSSDSGLETTGKHLVTMKSKKIPGDLSQRVAALGGALEAAYDAIGVAVVDGLSDAAAAELASANDVKDVSPDFVVQMDQTEALTLADAGSVSAASPLDPTDAVFYPRQWSLRAIQADQAWAAGHLGSADVTVAILDSGIGYTHPDLAGRVDLSRSRSFVPSDDALVAAHFPGAHPIADLRWHGTLVAAQVSSNAELAAGVTSRTTLIGVKVCNLNGVCSTSAVLRGIMYAAEQGADVINVSLAGAFLKSQNPGFVSVINDALTYANSQGSAIVVAAGNDDIDLDHSKSLFASYCDGMVTVCVSATGPRSAESANGPWTDLDTRAEYSNFGSSAIDVAAPGGRAGLTENGGNIWGACSPFTLIPELQPCQDEPRIIGTGGTSFSAAHAAGVAALIVERLGRKQPGLVRQRLNQTADDLGQPGTDPFYGKGRVNAARAVGVM